MLLNEEMRGGQDPQASARAALMRRVWETR
jgi:hypothetical protein